MALFQLLNSYLLNDISNIIYHYHFDSDKVNEMKKKLSIEYKQKIKVFDDGCILYYIDLGNTYTYNYINYYSKRSKYGRIFRFDKKNDGQIIECGNLPLNF